jgi:hypothetical protein
LLTTTGNRYISGCVTSEIEKVCSWSRQIESNTVALFVNHEFGYPYRNLKQLQSYGLPIIEDACHSYLANTTEGDMGEVGDFVIYSLPKVFPLQMGGILSYKSSYVVRSRVAEVNGLESYLSSVIAHQGPEIDRFKEARRHNHQALAYRFAKLGCKPRFDLQEHDVPGVFLFTVPPGTDLVAMKEFGWRHGIECSVFYGEDAFFIPVHQRLLEEDLDYFTKVFSLFLSRT